ncbi:50S ribosomal protein L32 [bacterium]|nr:50S ribosomal protein L32 [bacterium]
MGALPKRKPSTYRQGRRRQQHRLVPPAVVICPNCGNPKPLHLACPYCGEWENTPKESNGKEKAGSSPSQKAKSG